MDITLTWQVTLALGAQAPAPPGVKHLIRGLCAKQLIDMMDDLSRELDR